MDEDRKLVQQVADGNMMAFHCLIKKYQNLVCHMVYRLVKNRDDHEDLCQEIFTRVYFKINTFRHQAKLSTWIATIAYHETINWMKKHRKEETIHLEDIPVESDRFSLADAEWEDPSDGDLHALVRQQVEKLPPAYRTILTLYHLEGFKYAEISEITGLPEGTVKSYLFRARKLLKEKIQCLIPMEEITWNH